MTDIETLTMLRDGARQWVSAEHPVTLEHEDARVDMRARWEAMAALGWTGMTVSEADGGLDMGLNAYCAVAEEMGRELLSSPMLSTGLLGPALLRGRQDLLGEIVAGTAIVALATGEGAHQDALIRAVATAVDGGWHLRGQKRYVLDGAEADWFILSANADQPALFLVPRSAVAIVPLDTIDGRSFAHVSIDAAVGADARLDVDAGDLAHAEDLARLGLAAEMLGAATRAHEITLDYLKTREQFGRLIGSFQALQHRAAQMLVEIELARACVAHGCGIADDRRSDFAEAATLAKFMAGEALHHISNEMVQMHGGIGMTAEHPAGRYLKWARVSEALLGGQAWLAGRYADLNGY